MLKGKKIVLGITGSIAAYKSCLIIRGLIKRGAEVQVVITPAGKEFITPITLSALTHKPVVSEFFSQRDGTWNSHVDLGLWADAMVIAPCTASTMGKMAHGIADNMLITTYLSMKAPVFIAPAMDLDMYKHPSTQANMKTLLSYGNHIIEPEVGFLASGLEGKGRMEEPDVIVDYLDRYFQMKEDEANAEAEGKAEEDSDALLDLSGKKVMITAGPTYEKIDPVRFIGNYSSGKMGFALAEECLRRGADVTLIAGPVALNCSPAIHRINVESCEEMYQAATQAFGQTDAAILCAAVADFKPSTVADRKIKREKDDLELTLVPTHDIAAALGGMKQKHQRIVAFALETNDEENNAQKKRVKKNADFIVLNSTRNPGTTFRTDDNQITIISEKGKKEYEKKPFVNDRQWTHLQFQKNERIQCNFNLQVTKYDKDQGVFTCKATIQANRPVYNSAYTTTLYNNVDENFMFKFAEFDQLEFNEEQIDNQLTALFAYYAYLLIGLDLDSFSPKGGEDVLQRCMNLTNNAQNLDFPGWKAFDNDRNRFAIINDYLDGAMEPFRQLQYDYYRKGLDEMANNVERGRTEITTALETGLKKAKENRPLSMLPQIWTDYKKDELANIYKGKGTQKEKESVYEILNSINPSQNKFWDKIKE